MCAEAAGKLSPQDVRVWRPRTWNHPLRDENQGGGLLKGKSHTASPLFPPFLVLSLSVLSPSTAPLPLCPPYSHLRPCERPAFWSAAGTPQRSATRRPRPCAPARALPSPALSVPGLTQKSRLKPSRRYLMHRRPPRKRPMLRTRRGIPSPQARA